MFCYQLSFELNCEDPGMISCLSNGDNPNPPEGAAQLNVTKNIDCISTGGNPSNEAICGFVGVEVIPEDFTITVTGNDPIPSSFGAIDSGTLVTLGADAYSISEDSFNELENLKNTLGTDNMTFELSVSDNCSIDSSGTVVGNINSGEQQTCGLLNTVNVTNGTVPANSS